MAEKVLMIALSPTMETGTIVKWHKHEGDFVNSGDVICEVETDKATMEYESMNEGTLLKIVLPEGKEARIEEPIAIIGEKGEDVSDILGEINKAQGVITRKKGQKIEPTLKEQPVKEEGPSEGQEKGISQNALPSVPSKVSDRVHLPEGFKASPLARQMAQQHSIDLMKVRGTGPDGRIIKRDIEAMISQPTTSIAQPTGEVIQEEAATLEIKTEEIKVTGKRKVIAKRLSESKYTAPHYYLRTIVTVDGLIAARNELNKKLPDKVSFNAFLMKFTAEALKRYRMVNASWNGDTITQFGSADIGLAVAQPDGLITPIVRNCWNKGIIEIDRELKVLIEKALNNSLRPEEYSGATFTITNLGSFGILEFTAIINPPGSAILAVGKITREPVVGENDEIEIKSNMALTLSCDHRVVDGAVGAMFMKELQEMMENPIKVLY
jgi:pyruvate dehydrogenase E2 component (dihydrolipoamide acetyltransferase)